MSLAPEQPRGWPSAIAPPLTFTRLMSGCNSRSHASTTEAKASLISKRSIWSSVSPTFFSARWVAGIGPVSMIVGSTPARAVPTTRARGRTPSSVARSGDMNMSAAAPSEICEELAAVTTPSGLKDGVSEAILSRFTGPRTPLVGVEDGAVGQRHSHDLPREPALGDRAAGLLVAPGREPVELLPLEPPRLGDQLRGDPLGHDVVALLEAGRERPLAPAHHVRTHRHACHVLDATRGIHLVLARRHPHRGAVGRLLPPAAP